VRFQSRGVVFQFPPISFDLLVVSGRISGARGCTPHSCGFRDLHQEFKVLGFQIFGVSTQDTAYQKELVNRVHLPFEVLRAIQKIL
jgi:peroxiredoxin